MKTAKEIYFATVKSILGTTLLQIEDASNRGEFELELSMKDFNYDIGIFNRKKFYLEQFGYNVSKHSSDKDSLIVISWQDAMKDVPVLDYHKDDSTNDKPRMWTLK